jgi:hypothetical protein
MPGFRRSETTTQSLLCASKGCAEKAKDMCLEHMSAFCAKHYAAHLDEAHDGLPPTTRVKKA